MNLLPEKYQVKEIGEPMGTNREPDGSRTLSRPMRFEWLGQRHEVEQGFPTDFSSYPRALILWGFPILCVWWFQNWEMLVYWVIPFLWPAWQKVDKTGVRHDKAWRDDDFGMSWFKGNFLFFCSAMTGKNWHTRATPPQALAGFLALTGVAIFKTIARNFK